MEWLLVGLARTQGRRKEVTFRYFVTYMFTVTMTFLRRESITVGDKTINALVCGEELKQELSLNQYHGFYTIWLDPEIGLWVKRDFRAYPGSGNIGQSRSSQTLSIVLPRNAAP
jgi:hypothetical protein